MIAITKETKQYSPEEYLELEVNSQERHEYRQGEILTMTGGTPNHNQIALNLSSALNFALKRQPYRAFVTDQRLWIPQRRLYTYPDIMVVRGELELQEGRRDTITNPLIIAEVLSKSTEGYDRGEKFSAYRTISSFQEYIIITQHLLHAEQFVKNELGHWLFSEYEGEDAVLSFASIPLQISLADIYDKVDFEVGY